MDQGDIMAAIKLLTKCVQLRSKALFKGHPDLGKSADKLAQCYMHSLVNFVNYKWNQFKILQFLFAGKYEEYTQLYTS